MDEEVDALIAHFKHALIASFCHGRSGMAVLKKVFDRIGFTGLVQIELMDTTHIPLYFEQGHDYNRCFWCRTWNILGYPLRVTKHTYDFDPRYDASIILI